MTKPPTYAAEPASFEEILAQMNQAGHFAVSVLASEDGLPVAVAPSPAPYDAATVAAMVTLVKDFVVQTQARLGLSEVDEVSIVISDRSRLVCRYLTLNERPFVLAVILPPQRTYRRLTTLAIQEIKKAW
ncbi:MAG: hypothetical protein HY868_26920 [Chloroflexi bacterium]|nr:hypothetical protein [Chloroflexota bacterium]